MQVRYDFKGSYEVSRTDEAILIKADDELKRRQVESYCYPPTRKGVDTKALSLKSLNRRRTLPRNSRGTSGSAAGYCTKNCQQSKAPN